MNNPTDNKPGLVGELKIAFWASLTNANEVFQYLDHDSMEEMIEAGWKGFEPPAVSALRSHERMREALERVANGRRLHPYHANNECCLCHQCAEAPGNLRVIAHTALQETDNVAG